MSIVSLFSFIMFGGQRSKNVHDVRKVCPGTTFCVLACFVEFYVFVFDEIDLKVLNLYTNIFVFASSRKTSPRTIQGSLRKELAFSQRLS